MLFVIVSEMLVDWLKHAFITKFNHVRASVYERFTDVLAKDVLQVGSFASRPSMKDKKVHQPRSHLDTLITSTRSCSINLHWSLGEWALLQSLWLAWYCVSVSRPSEC